MISSVSRINDYCQCLIICNSGLRNRMHVSSLLVFSMGKKKKEQKKKKEKGNERTIIEGSKI